MEDMHLKSHRSRLFNLLPSHWDAFHPQIYHYTAFSSISSANIHFYRFYSSLRGHFFKTSCVTPSQNALEAFKRVCVCLASPLALAMQPAHADMSTVSTEEELLRTAPLPHERVVYWGSGSPQGTV